MNKTKNVEAFEIRVNRLSTEREKLIPYCKYIKDDYPQLSKVVPKHSILYKAKYKPEIVVNEFHQTSNNYNNNYHIKASSNNIKNNSYNFNIKLNDDLKNTYNNTDYLNYNNKENNTKDILIFNKSREIKSPLNSRFSNKIIEVNRNNKNEKIFNTSKYNKYYKQKKVSLGTIDLFNSNNKFNTEGGETSVETINNSGNKINKTLFFSSKKKIPIQNSIKNTGNTIDLTFAKMEIYRIKLFLEFLKYFQKYSNNYIKNYKKIFFNEIKMQKTEKQIVKNRTADNYFNKRINKNFFFVNNNNLNNDDINTIEILKSSTTKDYYKIYTQLKKRKSTNSNLKNIFNSYNNTDSNDNNDNNNKNKNIYSLSLSRRKTKNRNITQRINKNYDTSSFNKKIRCQSPSFRIGNRTFTNRDISFGKEKSENELYRDSKELNKKFEQIQRRHKKINFFNKNMSILTNRSLDNQINISNELNQIKKYIQENKKESRNQNSFKNVTSREKNNNLNDEIVRIRNNNVKKYRIMKVNVNKNLMNKNNIYQSKKIKKENKIFSIVIKNIVTKDNLMHININYYFIKLKNKNLKSRYDLLERTKAFSTSLLHDGKKEIKNKLKLKSIKEEDISMHNSKICDENDTNITKDNKVFFDFIKKVNNIFIKCYKRNFIYKIKTNIFTNKIIEIEDNNLNNKVYSRKRGYHINLNKIGKASPRKYNKNNDGISENKIDILRAKLINFSMNLKKSNY